MPTTPVSESLIRLGLTEALPVSQDATTSRVVVNNDLLRTVLFTFDAGQALTEHASPKAVVVTLLEGEMDFSVGERTERLVAGDVVYLAPGERHALTAATACRMQLVMVETVETAKTAEAGGRG
ncbi:cupin domain-containing protein [Actinomyces howellii]|uniref:Cupin domain n=1 Tax=Actinomyces howellii TaxID=52771 RepID=A0A448HFC7_9ACTO|nr:cupin domain-containing protein [Actinomyces howellii]VEG27059.1 Cupin domain [Actinomyces howellii]